MDTPKLGCVDLVARLAMPEGAPNVAATSTEAWTGILKGGRGLQSAIGTDQETALFLIEGGLYSENRDARGQEQEYGVF